MHVLPYQNEPHNSITSAQSSPLRNFPMNILSVLAHPEPASFNGALKDVTVREFERMGHKVVVSGVYGMGWQPALGAADFEGERANAGYLDLSECNKAIASAARRRRSRGAAAG